MAATDIATDTIPCPAPESGLFAVVRIEVSEGADQQAPEFVSRVVEELRKAMAKLRCPSHDSLSALRVAFGPDDDPTVRVVTHDCCSELDELVGAALQESTVFRLIVPG